MVKSRRRQVELGGSKSAQNVSKYPGWPVFLLVLIFRLANVFCLQTFFQPDEYFQSWEKAHLDVFGYGFETWEWKLHVRPCLVPALFGGIFRLASALNFNYLLLGKLFGALVAAAGDIFTYALAINLTSKRSIASKALIASMGSAFTFFVAPRAFSNTYEMVLTTAALAYWPFAGRVRNYFGLAIVFAIANVAIILRPSNAFLWLVLGLRLLSQSRTTALRAKVAGIALFTTLIVQILGLVGDVVYYKTFLVSLLMFFKVNFTNNVAVFYGSMPWHFYISQAIPLMLMGYLPATVLALWKYKFSFILVVFASQLLLFSFISHKEIRFIFFLLPLLHTLLAACTTKKAIYLGMLINVPVATYLSLVHQRGVIDVIEHIRTHPEIAEVSFLMPCHSTPWHSHMHRPELDASFLTCEPPLMVADPEGYLDEADQFYEDPTGFLNQHPEKLASTIVYFDALSKDIEPILASRGYKVTKRFFNSHFHDDWRRRGDVIVAQLL